MNITTNPKSKLTPEEQQRDIDTYMAESQASLKEHMARMKKEGEVMRALIKSGKVVPKFADAFPAKAK